MQGRTGSESCHVLANLVHGSALVGTLATFYVIDAALVGFAVSASAICLAALSTAVVWSRRLQRSSVPDQAVPVEKAAGLREAATRVFGRLLFVPRGPLLRVGDAKWSLETRRAGATVRAALASIDVAMLLIVATLALLGMYVAFTGDFGLALSRVAVGAARHVTQLLILLCGSWVVLAYLFHAIVLMMSKGEKA